jgi:acetylornithine deacetylase/succinyl-diaminopimelate desuccinylase family protein
MADPIIDRSGEMASAKKQILKLIDEMEEEIVEAVSDLVSIQSVNPKYPGQDYEKVVGGETRANQALAKHYRNLGCEVDFFEAEPRRANLIGIWKGTGGGRSLAFNGHIDVVPVSEAERWEFSDPFSGRVKNRHIYGRGSADMKAGLVAQVKAAEAIARAGFGLKGDLILQSVVGEEVMDHLAGATAVARKYPADAAIVSEPTAPPAPLSIVPVTPGLWWMSITCEGKPVHSSVRDELIRAGGRGSAIGVNAVEKAVFILTSLQRLEEQWGQSKSHPLFRPGHFTIHPGVIQGGPHGVLVPFIVSEYCTIEYAIWYSPDEKAEDVRQEIEEFVTSVARLDPWLLEHPPTMEWKLNWPPSVLPVEHPICQALAAAHTEAAEEQTEFDSQPNFQGFAAVCDAVFLNREGTPAVTYGPGSLFVAHAINERVSIAEVIQATKTYAMVALDWCGLDE